MQPVSFSYQQYTLEGVKNKGKIDSVAQDCRAPTRQSLNDCVRKFFAVAIFFQLVDEKN